MGIPFGSTGPTAYQMGKERQEQFWKDEIVPRLKEVADRLLFDTPTFYGEPICFCEYCGNALHTDEGRRCRSCGATPEWDDVKLVIAAKRREACGLARPAPRPPNPMTM